MYYSPPKSSIWGHSLRKMKPDVQRKRLDSFLSAVVSDHVFTTGSVIFQPGIGSPVRSDEFDAHFGELLNAEETRPGFLHLSEAQFELCFRELLVRPDLFESGRHGATVLAFYTIKAWNVGGVDVPTSSGLGVYYGAKPIVSPRFSFETLAVFDYLREAFEAAKLCKLNPKHIKGRVQRAPRV